MVEQLGTLSPERERPSPEFRTAKRRPPKRPRPSAAVARPPIHRPQWLLDALRQRGLQPSDERPMHRLLSERDLPPDCEEHEKVVVTTGHKKLEDELPFALRLRYEGQNVFVGADLMVYFDGHDPNRTTARRLGPDLMVALDVPDRPRDTYAVWEEGKAPDFVLELLSKSTWEKDVMRKPALYRRMGAREYFLVDPIGRIVPRLWGWRFQDGRTVRVPYTMVTSGLAGLYSETLDLHLCHTHPWPDLPYDLPEAGKVRWRDPKTGELLETPKEGTRRADEQEQRADAQEQRADAQEQRADAEARQSKKERQRADEKAREAESERQRADEKAREAEKERQRADRFAQQVKALEARLAASEGRSPR